jgi:hypothetical protein
MELHIALEGRKDLSGQLYRRLREAILFREFETHAA